jgi:acetylglutamate kinase
MSKQIPTDPSLDHVTPREKAEILAQALPYIRKYHGKTIVIKYGGNAMTDPALQQDFAEDVVLLKLVGMNPVVVHGGGPQIDEALAKIGKKGTFIQGMRVTDQETMDVVEWVLGGEVQQDIVSLINAAGGKAVGLTGFDGGMIRARKLRMMDKDDPSKEHDIGQVGEIESIDPSVVKALQDDAFIPVISPIGFGEKHDSFNINADLVAAKLAEVLKAEKLMMLTNTPGVLDKHHLWRHAAQDQRRAGRGQERRERGAHHRRPRAARHAAGDPDRPGLRDDDPVALTSAAHACTGRLTRHRLG